ncbi:MAG: tetratricopeptide repeat protein [Ignavibacteria bacterium]|nr:tetratricopeptide repeat protein [Ignavibacteria bacterium]
MIKAKKKISKREMKEDALVTAYVKATKFYEQNKKKISMGVTALAVIIIASVLYANNQAQNNESASTQFGRVYQLYDSGQYQLAIDGMPERNIIGLRSIVDNYGSTRAGELARFYLANAYYQLGRYDESLEAFEDFSSDSRLLSVSRLSGIAACAAAKEQYRKAAEFFEKSAVNYPGDVSNAENLSNAAHNYALAGEKEKALNLYGKLKKDHPTTAFGRDAERFITQLSM